jgi:hypothetical protein
LALAFGINKTTENVYTIQMLLPAVAAASMTKTEKSFSVTAAERTKMKILKMIKPHFTQIFFWHWHLASIRDFVLSKYQRLLKIYTLYKCACLL